MASRLLRVQARLVTRTPWTLASKPTRFALTRSSQVRWAATAVAEMENEPPVLDPTPPKPRLGLDGRPLPPDEVLATDVASPVAGDPPDPTLFSSLKGRFAYETLKAITVKPHQLITMTPVQQAVLSLLPDLVDPPPAEGELISARRKGTDLLVKSKTGTGKTLAFLVPAIEKRVVDVEDSGKRARIEAGLPNDPSMEGQYRRAFSRDSIGCLIISPTRELASQIAVEAAKLSTHHKEFEVKLVVGGESKRFQMKGLMKGRKDIVVATPGRMRDLLTSEPSVPRALAQTSMFILDEADTLLDMGFRDDIDFIASYLPEKTKRQTFLFSATISPQVKQIADKYLDPDRNFINTVLTDDSPVHAHIPQHATVLSSSADQILHVLRLISHDQLANPGRSKVMIFLQTTKTTQLFADVLKVMVETLPAGTRTRIREIHSGLDQDRRTKTSDGFRNDWSGSSVLITSDVSARGVDYPDVSRVIQVGVPSSGEQYIHRVGRTGRAGRKGRGDIVLLPFEANFPRIALPKVPIQQISTAEIAQELDALATKFDEDPQAFFKDVVPLTSGRQIEAPKFGRGSKPADLSFAIRPYQAPCQPKLAEQQSKLSIIMPGLEPDMAEKAFTSLLGYYIGRLPDIGVHKRDALEGLQEWCTGALAMASPPHTSDRFLERLGYGGSDNDGRRGGFGRGDNRQGGGGRPASRSFGSSWAGESSPREYSSPPPPYSRRPGPQDLRQQEDRLRSDESIVRRQAGANPRTFSEHDRYPPPRRSRDSGPSFNSFGTPTRSSRNDGGQKPHWSGRGSTASKNRRW